MAYTRPGQPRVWPRHRQVMAPGTQKAGHKFLGKVSPLPLSPGQKTIPALCFGVTSRSVWSVTTAAGQVGRWGRHTHTHTRIVTHSYTHALALIKHTHTLIPPSLPLRCCVLALGDNIIPCTRCSSRHTNTPTHVASSISEHTHIHLSSNVCTHSTSQWYSLNINTRLLICFHSASVS